MSASKACPILCGPALTTIFPPAPRRTTKHAPSRVFREALLRVQRATLMHQSHLVRARPEKLTGRRNGADAPQRDEGTNNRMCFASIAGCRNTLGTGFSAWELLWTMLSG